MYHVSPKGTANTCLYFTHQQAYYQYCTNKFYQLTLTLLQCLEKKLRSQRTRVLCPLAFRHLRTLHVFQHKPICFKGYYFFNILLRRKQPSMHIKQMLNHSNLALFNMFPDYPNSLIIFPIHC